MPVPASQAMAPDGAGLHVDGAADGHQAEEEEHDEFAGRRVGDRPRTAHVRVRGDDRRQRDRHHPAVAEGDQRRGDRQRGEHRDDDRAAHRPRREPALRGRARQADAAAGFRTTRGVADVVLQVGDDLHHDRAGQRQHGDPRDEGVVDAPRNGGADENRDRRDPQRLRTQRHLPRGGGAGADHVSGGGGRGRHGRRSGGAGHAVTWPAMGAVSWISAVQRAPTDGCGASSQVLRGMGRPKV